MRKEILILAFIVLCLNITQTALSQDKEKYVHCIMLDKTLSMTGSGGGRNIWPDVQEYCYNWIDGINVPSTVVFFTYDKNLHGPQTFELTSDSDKSKVKNAIENVKIDGRYTWIASNLEKAWNYICNEYPNSVKTIYLITDGIEEEVNSNFSNVLKRYSASRGDYDYLYYVDLNGSAPKAVIDSIENTIGAGIGTGFHKFFKIKPSFEQVGYVIGKSQGLEQLFEVEKVDIANCSFTVKIDSVTVFGEGVISPNVSISPARVSFKDLSMEGDKYKYNFNIVFHNNTERPCDIFVKLEGETSNDTSLDFVPDTFKIQVRNKEKIHIKTKEGKGWQIR